MCRGGPVGGGLPAHAGQDRERRVRRARREECEAATCEQTPTRVWVAFEAHIMLAVVAWWANGQAAAVGVRVTASYSATSKFNKE